ncbi:MAG: sterol desaturase family protein [Bacteroidales bacterium]|nr:sterol desaturase family protein [Bacteroidales bacterium]
MVGFYILIAILAFLFMEFVAWFTHKYIMHGPMWGWHKDHHIPHNKTLEKNDRFVFIFALPGAVLIILGVMYTLDYVLAAGIGIALYGLAYFLFHDVLVHQRIKLFKGTKNKILKATVTAHFDHHRPHSNQNFGFLIAPWKYYKQEFSKK